MTNVIISKRFYFCRNLARNTFFFLETKKGTTSFMNQETMIRNKFLFYKINEELKHFFIKKNLSKTN